MFVLEFFDLKMSQVSHIFNQIFAKVVNKYLAWLNGYSVIGGVSSSGTSKNADIILAGIA